MNKSSFLEIVESCLLKNIGVEIGVWNGENVQRLLNKFQSLKLICVDPYKAYSDYDLDNPLCHCKDQIEYDRLYNSTKSRIEASFPNRTQWIRKFSKDAASEVLDYSCDYVFIDGNHSYESVLEDIVAWESKIRCGGLLIGHDLDRQRKGKFPVRDAVTKYFKGNFETIGNEYWYVTV